MGIMRSRAANGNSYVAVGTFVVHDNEPLTPMQPKAQKAFRKDIFTPLKLETMFNPPSPQETRVATPETSLKSSSSKRMDGTPDRSVPFLFNGGDSSNAFPFTFSVQRPLCPDPVQHNCTNPQVDKSRLRLFQFHYDTFTREHLSALVDAIPVSSSSLSASSASIHDGVDSSPSMLSHYRPAKRIKLSPPDHLPRSRRRHRLSLPRNVPTGGRKDNIRESKGVGENVELEAPDKLKDLRQEGYSSLGFKRQAADSMEQIRRDTQRSISPMSVTAEISALSIGTNPPLQSFERRRTPVSVPHMMVGLPSPHVRRKLALREDSVGSGPKSTLHPEDRTAHIAAGVTPANHLNPTDARSRSDMLRSKRPSDADGEVLPHPDSEDSTLSATQSHDSREEYNVRETPVFTSYIEPQPDGAVTQNLPEQQSSAPPLPVKDWTINLIKNVTADRHYISSTLSSNPAKRPPPTPLRSALKPGTPTSSENTPHPVVVNRMAGVAPRRSVSFSDGRTNGRIRGLHDSQTDGSQSSQSSRLFPDDSIPMQAQEIPVNNPSELFETSARADRIAEMLECLEGDSVGAFPALFWARESNLMDDRFVEGLTHSSCHGSNACPGPTP